MEVILRNIDATPEGIIVARRLLFEQGKYIAENYCEILNVTIAPGFHDAFMKHMANRYFGKSVFKWKLPEDVNGEFMFAMDMSGEINRSEKFEDLFGVSGVVRGCVRTSTDQAGYTITIEAPGEFNRNHFEMLMK